jgi:5-methyltetrahydropteroyltriglutamate--homocysteine methyltransferase
MADDFKYHIDHHGSLVRPPALLAARAAGLSGEALAATVEEAVEAAAHLQRRLVLSTVGDGQFRREHFESVVYDHVPGFAPVTGPTPLAELAGIPFARRRAIAAGLDGAAGPAGPAALVADGRLAQAEVAPVVAVVDRPVFVALPSPGYLAAVGSALDGPAAVDAIRSAGAALAAILHAEIEALAAEGVAYVALGNPLYPVLLTVEGRQRLLAVLPAGVSADAVLAAMIEADRAAVSGLTAPEDFRVGLDLTDSGPLPTTAYGWDPAAFETLIDATPFHRLSVDFPADPAARLPLDLVKPGLVISLGVVDVSSPELETVESILDLVDPIVEERGEYDVAIATNGGFAQSADRPLMTQAEQNEKLRLVEMVARYYWGNEI